ncbi:MAG: hypothetical protein M3Q97_04575 [Bacteroidota bacterium]|nr:hypothetical protein [Bacteroidota bacterium]
MHAENPPRTPEPLVDNRYCLQTRVHALNGYIPVPGDRRIFIKREDELSSGISGSKYRKFASLIPWLAAEKPDEVLLIGSDQSNNITGLLQALNETRIQARLMLLRGHDEEHRGNSLWLAMLCPVDDIIWIERDEWPQVEEQANKYASGEALTGKKVIVIPEGSAHVRALPGAMTLAEDILRNESEMNLHFDHIFIDSGTGLSAAGMIIGVAALGFGRHNIHITLIAGEETYFREKLEFYSLEAAKVLQRSPDLSTIELHFYKPVIAPSFGACPPSVLKEIKVIARETGILMEPIYSVKHLMTVRSVIENKGLTGNILFINSGGSFALSGWQEKLAKLV